MTAVVLIPPLEEDMRKEEIIAISIVLGQIELPHLRALPMKPDTKTMGKERDG